MVSIIIPTYQRNSLLLDTLKAFQQQSYLNWECLIVDDDFEGEMDFMLLEFINKDKRFHYFNRPFNYKKGPSSCRNFGLKEAKGKFVQFFDDDDIPCPEMLSTKVETFRKNEIDVAICPLQFYNPETNALGKINKIFSTNLIEDYFKHHIAWYVSGPMWKKTFLEEEFDPEIELMDDWDFNLRNITRKPRIGFIEIPLLRYCRRDSATTISSTNNYKQLVSEFLAYKKNFNLIKNELNIGRTLDEYYIKRIINIFRKIDKPEEKLRQELLKEILSNFSYRRSPFFARIGLAYCSYKLFNRGYFLVY